MPWTKKDGAPAYAYAIEEIRALITGTADAWLTDWLWLLGGTPVAVVPLCAAGPPSCDDFTEGDFLSAATSGNRVGLALNLLQLVPKLECWAKQRLFGAYCEFTTASSGMVCTELFRQTTGVESGANRVVANRYIPPSDWMSIRKVSGPGTGGHIVYVSNTAGQFQANIAQGGFVKTDDDGTVWFSYPWVQADRWIWMNADGEEPTLFAFSSCTQSDGVGTPYEPPPVTQPPSAIAPEPGVYDDLGDVGAELDLIERKLEILLDDAANRQVATLWPLVPVGGPFAVTNDTDISIPEGGGLIVAVTNIGNQTDETYGEPRRLHRLGRVTVGGPSGWLPPYDITVSPMMLVGLPLEVTRARVHVMPPAIAQVQLLQRAEPVG